MFHKNQTHIKNFIFVFVLVIFVKILHLFAQRDVSNLVKDRASFCQISEKSDSVFEFFIVNSLAQINSERKRIETSF